MTLKKYIYYPLSFLIYIIIFYLFNIASIGGVVYPFAFALLFAAAFVSRNLVCICPAFLISSFLADFSFPSIISAICTTFVVILPFFIHLFTKNKIKTWEILCFSALSQLARILFSVFNEGKFYYDIISMAAGVLICLLFIQVLKSTLIKKSFKLTIFEYIGGAFLLLGLASGLSSISFTAFPFIKTIVAFTILITAYSLTPTYSIFLASIFGIGSLLGSNNPVYLTPFIIWTLLISFLKTYKCFLMPIVLFLGECLCGYYFQFYQNFSWMDLVAVGIGCIIFMCLPNCIFDKVNNTFDLKTKRIAVKSVVNRNREVLNHRVKTLGVIFEDMNRIFRNNAKKTLSKESMSETLIRGIKRNICENCPEKTRCFHSYLTEMNNVFNELSDIAFEKGKINLLDLPPFLNTHCKNVTSIISNVNTQCAQFKRYSELVGNVDISKLLIADQFVGMSDIMKKLSQDIEKPISFDINRERRIIEELSFNGIICEDVVVFERDIHSLEITILLRNEDKDKEILTPILEKICGQRLAVSDKLLDKPGFTTLILKNIPKLDCNFGISQRTKDGESQSGDCYSIQKLDTGKFMFAVCDGMGSGDKAKELSENAISLLENFYKAGFDGDLAITSVNRLLTIQKEESFSAIDISVLDLNNGILDLIKMGTPSSVIVKSDSCEIVEGGSLPLGVINNGEQTSVKRIVESGNFVILMSDGVADSFENDDKLLETICSIETKNPQTFSEEILNKAIANNQGLAKDDMTVLVISIF